MCATVLHWDSKLLETLLNVEKVDRLVIIKSDGENEKILSIPNIENGTGLTQATVIFEVTNTLLNYTLSFQGLNIFFLLF